MMCMEKHVFVKKCLQIDGVETHRLSGKKKVQSAAFSKEVHADSLQRYERTYLYRLLWKNSTVNSSPLCQFLKQNSP